MIVPVTVIGSVVVACLLCVELVWANASGAISITTRVTIVLFMMPPFYWASFCSWFGLNRSHFLFLPQPTFTSSAAHIVVVTHTLSSALLHTAFEHGSHTEFTGVRDVRICGLRIEQPLIAHFGAAKSAVE